MSCLLNSFTIYCLYYHYSSMRLSIVGRHSLKRFINFISAHGPHIFHPLSSPLSFTVKNPFGIWFRCRCYYRKMSCRNETGHKNCLWLTSVSARDPDDALRHTHPLRGLVEFSVQYRHIWKYVYPLRSRYSSPLAIQQEPNDSYGQTDKDPESLPFNNFSI